MATPFAVRLAKASEAQAIRDLEVATYAVPGAVLPGTTAEPLSFIDQDIALSRWWVAPKGAVLRGALKVVPAVSEGPGPREFPVIAIYPWLPVGEKVRTFCSLLVTAVKVHLDAGYTRFFLTQLATSNNALVTLIDFIEPLPLIKSPSGRDPVTGAPQQWTYEWDMAASRPKVAAYLASL